MPSVAFLCPQNAPKSLAAGASPQTPLVELTALPSFLAEFKGPISKTPASKGMGRERSEGHQNDLCPRAPETLAPPLKLLVGIYM